MGDKVSGTTMAILALIGLLLWRGNLAGMEAGGAFVATKTQVANLEKKIKTAPNRAELEMSKLEWDRLYETGGIDQSQYSAGIDAYLKRLAV